MFELLQFSLLDMTPYNRQSWFNLVGEYNQSLWFIYPIAIVITLLLLSLLFKSSDKVSENKSVRWAFVILGVAWIWNGAVFHLQYFANLNWAAPWFGGMFLAQGCLILLIAFFMKSALWVSFASVRGRLAIFLLFIGLLVYPLSQLLEDRSFSQVEWFPLLPTPVLLVTIALVILLSSRWRYALVIIPILWGIISAAFALSLGLLEFYFIAGALLICLLHFLLTIFTIMHGKNGQK